MGGAGRPYSVGNIGDCTCIYFYVALVQIESLTGIYHASNHQNIKERVCLYDWRVDEYEYYFVCGSYREYEMVFGVPSCSLFLLLTCTTLYLSFSAHSERGISSLYVYYSNKGKSDIYKVYQLQCGYIMLCDIPFMSCNILSFHLSCTTLPLVHTPTLVFAFHSFFKQIRYAEKK